MSPEEMGERRLRDPGTDSQDVGRRFRSQETISQYLGRREEFPGRTDPFFGRGYRDLERGSRIPERLSRDPATKEVIRKTHRRNTASRTTTSTSRTRTRTHVHKQGKSQSKWLLPTNPFIAPRFHSSCPPRWRTSSRTRRASCTG